MKSQTPKQKLRDILRRRCPDLDTGKMTEQQLNKELDRYDKKLYRKAIIKEIQRNSWR